MASIARGTVDQNAEQTFTGDTAWHQALTAASSSFVAGEEYLFWVQAKVGGSTSANTFKIRAQHGGTQFDKSLHVYEPRSTTDTRKQQYNWFGVFTQPGGGAEAFDVEVANNVSTSDTVRVESLFLYWFKVGDLSKVVNTIMKSEFRNLKSNYLGDRAELLPGGRYNELVNELQLKDCDFHEAVRFISALETSNPGTRITNIEIDSAGTHSGRLGMVAVGLEVKMMGMYQGDGIDADWQPVSAIAYDPGHRRNPFGESGLNLVVDPDMAFRDKVYNLKVTMDTGDSLWIKDTTQEKRGARECMLKKHMPVFEPEKIHLMKIHEDYFIVRRDDGKLFKLIIRQYNETIHGEVREHGTIKELIEIE